MKFLKYFTILLAFYGCQALFFFFGLDGAQLFTESNLLNWDAEHYAFIAQSGYDQLRTAFFPLFPIIWNLTNLSALGITILNGGLFIFAFAALAREYQPRLHELLLIAAVPTFIFYFLPYSESFFFMGSTIILLGYRKNMLPALFAGFLICSLSRPAVAVFLPAIVLTEFLTYSKGDKSILRGTFSIAGLAIGLVIALVIQRLQVGEWLTFFQVQAEHWDNSLQVPELPLRSWAGLWITVLDGTALFVSLIAGYGLLKFILAAKSLRITTERSLVFSLFYLLGIGLLVLLFRGGALFSLNRFVFATAFFVVAAFYYVRQVQPFRSLYFALAMFLYWLFFNSFVHIQTLLKYLAATLFNGLAILSFTAHKSLRTASLIVFFAGLVILQLYFFHRHISGYWIG